MNFLEQCYWWNYWDLKWLVLIILKIFDWELSNRWINQFMEAVENYLTCDDNMSFFPSFQSRRRQAVSVHRVSMAVSARVQGVKDNPVWMVLVWWMVRMDSSVNANLVSMVDIAIFPALKVRNCPGHLGWNQIESSYSFWKTITLLPYIPLKIKTKKMLPMNFT